jgi:hypothetical protein
MSILHCPSCEATFDLPPETQGRRLRCAGCGHQFTAPPLAEVEPASWPIPEVTPTDRPLDALPRRPILRKKKRTPVLLILTLISGSMLASCGLVVGLCYFLFMHEITEPLTARDRAILCDLSRLEPFSDDVPKDRTGEKYKRVRHLDGSHELAYEYEPPEGAAHTLYLQSGLTAEKTATDARTAYTGLNLGVKLGFKWAGEGTITEVERNDLFHAGDQSRCVLLQKDGVPVGNFLVVQKGPKVYHIMLVGLYFDTADSIKELMQPFLDQLDGYQP